MHTLFYIIAVIIQLQDLITDWSCTSFLGRLEIHAPWNAIFTIVENLEDGVSVTCAPCALFASLWPVAGCTALPDIGPNPCYTAYTKNSRVHVL